MAQVDTGTALVDLTNWLAGRVTPGGLDNPLANAFIQALYECGGKQLLDMPDTDAASVVRNAVEAIGSCASEIVEYDSEFGARFEQLAQQQIRAHPGQSAENWAKANRLVHEVAHAFAIIDYGKVAFYLSDQFANAMVGNLSFSIRGRGRPQELGAWEPNCVDTAVDAHRLYVNLALRDEFSDTSRDLWQFPGWAEAAEEAVQPLAACDPVYLTHLVEALPTVWDDAKAAQVVAEGFATLYGAGGGGTAQVVIDPFTNTGLRPGWRIDRSFEDAPPLDCSFDEGSPNAVGVSTHFCGGTADAANACWSAQLSTAELWCLDTFHPGRRTLSARAATGVDDDTAAPADPDPLFLQLSDGSRWWFRIGGAWGGRADGAVGAYGCANDLGVCGADTPEGTDGNIILQVHGEPVVDKSAPVWTVQVGLLGNPSTDYPPPVTMQVARAWFIAGHRWSGD